MNRMITDAGVARLPVGEGRAELLEEIMAVAPVESPQASYDAPPPRRRHWVPAIAAAAAVAAVVGGVVWIGEQRSEPTAVEPPVASAPGAGEIAVLEVPGWTATYGAVAPSGGELTYENGDQELEISWRPKALHDDYVRDRDDIGPREEVRVLGKPAHLWAYSRDDHTVIRDVVGDFTLEVRGSDMTKRTFLALLEKLEGIAPAELDSHLPDSFVSDAERPGVIAQMLDPIPVPKGFDRQVESTEVTRYQLGADVTGAVTCAWIRQYARARRSGDEAAVREAQGALRSARTWPVLEEMQREGDWSSVVWEYADAVVAGKSADDPAEPLAAYRDGLGCRG